MTYSLSEIELNVLSTRVEKLADGHQLIIHCIKICLKHKSLQFIKEKIADSVIKTKLS